jgi:F-type H+-transporting ATPase subunit a
MDVEFKFLQQTTHWTLILATVTALLLGLLVGEMEAYSLLFGALWGSLNLYLIRCAVMSLWPLGVRHYLKIALVLLIKFPLLYYIGYQILERAPLPPLYSLIGFSLLFVALFLQGVSTLPKPSKVSLLALGFLIPFAKQPPLHASLTSNVPEVPNIITFLHTALKTPWTTTLHNWESVLFSILLAAVIALIFCLGVRRCTAMPESKLQNFLELLTEGMQKFTTEILGSEGAKYLPFLGTLFIYILMMNWMVLLPFMKAPSSSLSITAALAICVFVLVQYLSIRNFGLGGYLYHMAGSPKGALGWAMVPLMFPIELLTQLSRPLTLAFRLFGNVVGEDILIGAFALFGITLFAFSPVGVPLQMPFMLFAMLTGLMQALVFTLLSAIYILLSMPGPEDHDH